MRNVRLSETPLAKRNWFPTLNDALHAEGLADRWPLGKNLVYGETVGFAAGGEWISVYRSTDGKYERPVHYATLMADTYPKGGEET
jgi:hypothetical protein